MEIDRQEVLRYMRMGKALPDAELSSRIDTVSREILAAVRPASRWILVPVADNADGSYGVGPLLLRSVDLRRTMSGCTHAFLFCATLGAGTDALLRRYGITSAADLLIAQAVAATLIEAYCDECELKMLEDPAVTGETLRMRYAPGYGDLPLATQRPLLDALDAPRRVGLSLTNALLLTPSKSVTAIIGSGKAPQASVS